MQYNMLDDGSLEPLPHPSIDTGAGLERVTMLAQGVDSAYLTDAFGDLIEVIEGWSGARYGHTPDETKALKVLADHGRSMSFLATDGIEPSNEGRGYVLRRVIRRAVQHGRRIGLEDGLVARLHGRVVELLGEAHPELVEHRERVAAELAAEEARFSRTLETGGKLLDDVLAGTATEVGARGRVPPARHLRLPDRADGRDRHRARKDGRRGRLRRADGRAARPRPGGGRRPGGHVGARERLRRRVRRLRAARRDHPGRRDPRARRRLGARQAARVAVLRPRRRPGGRPRLGRDRLGPGGRRGRRPRRRRPGGRRPRRARRAARRRARARARRHRGAAADDGKPHRHPPAARRAARGARRPRRPGRVVRRPRQAALRLPPRRADDAPTSCTGSRRS